LLPIGACERQVGASGAAELLDGFTSADSPEKAASRLTKEGRSWDLIEESNLAADDPRPRFSILRWRVPSYTVEAFRGELELLFFNDRLVSTAFYPSEPELFFQHVREMTGITLGESGVSPTDRRTIIRTGRDYRGSAYALWEDKRLAEEMRRWIRKFA